MRPFAVRALVRYVAVESGCEFIVWSWAALARQHRRGPYRSLVRLCGQSARRGNDAERVLHDSRARAATASHCAPMTMSAGPRFLVMASVSSPHATCLYLYIKESRVHLSAMESASISHPQRQTLLRGSPLIDSST
jgi:hypothetical protein